MKLILPKLLLVAVMATFADAQDVNQSPTVITKAGDYRGNSLVLEGDVVIQGVTDPAAYDGGAIIWNTETGEASMSGRGKLSSQSSGEYWSLQIGGGSEVCRIGSEVELESVDISFDGNFASSILCIDGNLSDFEIYGYAESVIDLSKAKLSGKQEYDIDAGNTLVINELEVKEGVFVEVSGYTAKEEYAILQGNLVMNGVLPAFAGEERFEYRSVDWEELMQPYGAVQFWVSRGENEEPEPFVPLSVSGTITIKSGTAVVFANEGDFIIGEDNRVSWKSDYRLPTTTDVLFVCSGVDEDSLSLLKPYAYCEDSWAEYSDGGEVTGGYEYIKPVDDRAFYARAGEDGRVYIYLNEKNNDNPSIPSLPDKPSEGITVTPGQTLVLGEDSSNTPTAQNPVLMQGGVADARALDDSLLNNKVITGSSGSLLTNSNQTMTLTGSDKIGYSVVGLAGNQHGANLEISASGNLTLAGDKYTAGCVKVQKGTVTISSGTTIGTGAAGDLLDLSSVAVSATNFGTISADVEIGEKSTLLNQGKVKGDVELGESGILTNNGTLNGSLTASGKVYGSGEFGDTVLTGSGLLHVGNSPGYQQHNSLTLARGTTLSFSVDGVTAATASNHGSGTYSVLKTNTLTITPGSGTITVAVDVTMGVAAAGSEPMSLTLLEVQNTTATTADFTLNLTDEAGLLEEGTTLTFDTAAGALVLKAAVSKAALAALMDSNSSNVANTMWASASAAQEMARTAEHQFLVGMPGQTTFWGAGVGSFMNVSGEQGFTSNFGGYAVGMQHAFTEKFRAGLAFGQMFGDFKSDDDQLKVEQTAMLPTLTAQYVTPLSKTSSLSVSGHLTYGVVENEADTCQAGTTGKAEWDDEVLNLGLRVAWNKQLGENVSASFYTGLTYQQVEQDSFTEEFTGGEREYRSGSMSSLSLPLGMTLRGIYQMEGTNVFAPELTLAYTGDIARENPEVKTSVYGFNRTGKGTNVGRSAFMLNVGANWMFDSTWSVGAFYTLEARSKQVNQSVNAALRCCF